MKYTIVKKASIGDKAVNMNSGIFKIKGTVTVEEDKLKIYSHSKRVKNYANSIKHSSGKSTKAIFGRKQVNGEIVSRRKAVYDVPFKL